MAVGAVEADRSIAAAIGAAGIRAAPPVIMVAVVVMVVMPKAPDSDHPRAVGTAARVRIAGVANLLATIGAPIGPRVVHRSRRDREREDRLGGDHEAGGDAAKRGHGEWEMVSAPAGGRLHFAVSEVFPDRSRHQTRLGVRLLSGQSSSRIHRASVRYRTGNRSIDPC